MARAAVNTALGELASVVKEMRHLGVIVWANSPAGDITLGPDPKKPKAEKPEVDPLANRREYYSEVLGYQVSDQLLEKLP